MASKPPSLGGVGAGPTCVGGAIRRAGSIPVGWSLVWTTSGCSHERTGRRPQPPKRRSCNAQIDRGLAGLPGGCGVRGRPGGRCPNPSGTGQPSVECGDPGATVEPAGFGTSGFANAETHYASGANGNPHAVSQYDVACYQVTSSH